MSVVIIAFKIENYFFLVCSKLLTFYFKFPYGIVELQGLAPAGTLVASGFFSDANFFKTIEAVFVYFFESRIVRRFKHETSIVKNLLLQVFELNGFLQRKGM